MKAITIWQPYAQAIALGLKKFETRSWATKYRGKLAIHASLKPLSKECKLLAEKYNIKDCALGEVIVVADLVDCVLMTEEFIQTIYPEYLSRQKAYLALAVVLPVVAVGAAAAICIVVVRKKKKALHAETDRTQSKTSD